MPPWVIETRRWFGCRKAIRKDSIQESSCALVLTLFGRIQDSLNSCSESVLPNNHPPSQRPSVSAATNSLWSTGGEAALHLSTPASGDCLFWICLALASGVTAAQRWPSSTQNPFWGPHGYTGLCCASWRHAGAG